MEKEKDYFPLFKAQLCYVPNNKMSRIKTELKDVNLYEKEDWIKMSNFLVVNLPKFEKAIQSVINNTKI
ncbi:MAG: hypothetical protein ACI9TK_001196 [Flavobacteriaceae bacterium]|jgi:hypothetical protein